MKNETRDNIIDFCVDILVTVMLVAVAVGLIKGGYALIKWLIGQ